MEQQRDATGSASGRSVATSGSGGVLLLAAVASAGAGLVHAAAAGTHNGDSTLMWLFAVTAAVQLAWAVLAISLPSRRVALAGVAIGVAAAVAWMMSRITGLPVIDSLSEVEEVGVQDAIAAALGALSAMFCGLAFAGVRPRAAARMPLIALGAVVLIALAVPGVAAQHSHGPSHEHGGHGDGGSEAAGDGHAHDHSSGADDPEADATTEGAAADHAAHGDHGSSADGGGHSGEPVISLTDSRVTPAQRAAAQKLIDDTVAGMARFDTVASVEAAGYVSIGDSITGYEHFVHIGNMSDGRDLDPNAIESVVFKVYPDGTRQLASAMYILDFGATMDDVPDIAGELTSWHDHQDLCWNGVRVVGRVDATGKCERGVFRGTAPMLHVWLLPHECGPFAGLEGHGEGCSHGHDEPAATGPPAGEERAAAAGP